MWRKRLPEQTHKSVLSVADQIARTLHSNEEYLPKKFECADYVIKNRSWVDGKYVYQIFFYGKRKPFCIIFAQRYYFNGSCFEATNILCNDVDLCMLRDLQIQLSVYCNEARKEYIHTAQSAAEAETSYKEALLNM